MTRRPLSLSALAAATVAMALQACGGQLAQPAKSPLDRAAFMEQTRCGPDDEEATIAPVIGRSAVVSVEPLYSNASSGKSGSQAMLRGATVVVSALPGVTPEWLDRALECHGAKAMLGHVQSPPNDPFWLPDASIDIDVRPAKDGFDIALSAFSADDARQILARANAFAAR